MACLGSDACRKSEQFALAPPSVEPGHIRTAADGRMCEVVHTQRKKLRREPPARGSGLKRSLPVFGPAGAGADAEAEQKCHHGGAEPKRDFEIDDHGLAPIDGLVSAHTSTMIQPTAVQPASRLSAKIATLLWCRPRRATKAGTK